MDKTCVLKSKNFKTYRKFGFKYETNCSSPAVKNCITLPKTRTRGHHEECRYLVLPKLYVDIWYTV